MDPSTRRANSSLTSLNPLFASKTHAPALPRPHLARPRLLGALRQASRRRVVVVCAPAGAGKTTLLSDFVRPNAHAWYTVDDLDDGASGFLHGLSLAVGCETTRSLDRLAYLAQIVGALAKCPEPNLLVIDDVHRLTDAAAVQALADLIRYLPPPARLVLVGRAVPVGTDAIVDWLTAQHQIARLSWEHFQLAEDEREHAAVVFKTASSGGWILGWAHPEGLDLARYLRNEVLAPLGAETVDRLARLSALPSFDPDLAAVVTDLSTDAARRLLQRIHGDTPLLERLVDDTYRFTETARSVLADLLSSSALWDVRHVAGLTLRDLDARLSAELLLAGGETGEAAASLASLPLTEWLAQSANEAHRLLDQIPFDDVGRHPRLVLAHAWALFVWKGETRDAARVLDAMTCTDADLELRFWHHYVVIRVNLALGHTPSAIEAHRSLVDVLQKVRREPSISTATSARMICRTAMVERLLGDSQAAVATATHGLTLCELSLETTRVERQLIHHVLGIFTAWDGDYHLADQHLAAALALASEPADAAERATIRNAQAGVARCRGEFIRALSHLDQALREPFLPSREQMLLTLQTAHALLDVQDFRGAARRYRSVASMLREGDRDGCFSRALAGLAICCAFLGLDAEVDVTLAQLRSVDVGPSHYDVLLAEGVRALRHSDPVTAANRFAEATQVTGTIGGLQDTWQAVLLEAQAHVSQSELATAAQEVEAFLDRQPGRAMPAVGLWVVRPVESVLASVHDRRADASLATLLKLGAADTTAPKLVHAVAAIDRAATEGSRQTEIRLFGPPRLIVDGEEVSWPYGLRHKAIELFWYGALHLEGFTRDQAIADLYPDRDPASGLKQVQVAVSNLRTVLADLLGGPGDQILARDGDGSFRLCLDATANGIVVETRVLDQLAEELRTHRRGRLPATIPDLFRGELLAGLSAEWIDPIRRYWMAIYLRTLGTLADRYARQGLLQQAIRCREQMLQIDPTIESAHKDLMRLYHAAGDRQAVESQMWLYTRLSRDELDAEPTPDVEELYHQLIARDRTNHARPPSDT